MEKEESFKKALSSAYAFVARRPHGTKELEKKLLHKGVETNLVNNIIEELLRKGFLNDYDVAYRWAESRIKNRLWGKAKLYNFLRAAGENIPTALQKVLSFRHRVTRDVALYFLLLCLCLTPPLSSLLLNLWLFRTPRAVLQR